MKLTKKEKKILIKELAQRCKDMVYMQAETQVKNVVNSLKESDFDNTGDELILDYKLKMCVGDILQIVGRHRRGK